MFVEKRRAAITLALLTLLGLPPQSTLLAADTDAAFASAALSPADEKALAFREIYGFPRDLSLIRSAAGSPAYSAEAYGVPLTAAEAAEVGRRVQLEQASHAAAAFGREQATWGGYYFDQHAGGAPVFLFTTDTGGMRSRLEKLLPQGTDFRVEQVARPLSALLKDHDAIVDAYGELRAAGIHITSTGLDLIGNGLVVGIDGLTDDAARTISERFGPDLTYKDSPPAQADSCPVDGCRPIKGGIKIVGTPTGFPCTAGFIARRSVDNSLAVITAGHCLWVQTSGDPFGTSWYHKTASGSNKTFGLSRYHTFANLSTGDVGLIEIDADETVYSSSANKIYTDLGSGTTHTVTGYVFDADQTLGSQACAYGAISNDYGCTTIKDPSETKESCADPPWGPEVCWDITGSKVYGYNLIPGDSGGPIFQRPNPLSTNVLMLGTHVHSVEGNSVPNSQDGWYTPYFRGVTAYNAISPGSETYTMCTTAAC